MEDLDIQSIRNTPSFGARLARGPKKPREGGNDENEASSSSIPAKRPRKEQDESSSKVAPTSKHSKHAPMVQSSKKAVSRSRKAVEVARKDTRDPRFDPVPTTDPAIRTHYQHHYEFLTDIQRNELSRLRKDSKVAKKRISSVPRDKREEAEKHINDISLTAQRLESALDRKRKAAADEAAKKEESSRWKKRQRRA